MNTDIFNARKQALKAAALYLESYAEICNSLMVANSALEIASAFNAVKSKRQIDVFLSPSHQKLVKYSTAAISDDGNLICFLLSNLSFEDFILEKARDYFASKELFKEKPEGYKIIGVIQ